MYDGSSLFKRVTVSFGSQVIDTWTPFPRGVFDIEIGPTLRERASAALTLACAKRARSVWFVYCATVSDAICAAPLPPPLLRLVAEYCETSPAALDERIFGGRRGQLATDWLVENAGLGRPTPDLAGLIVEHLCTRFFLRLRLL